MTKQYPTEQQHVSYGKECVDFHKMSSIHTSPAYCRFEENAVLLPRHLTDSITEYLNDTLNEFFDDGEER